MSNRKDIEGAIEILEQMRKARTVAISKLELHDLLNGEGERLMQEANQISGAINCLRQILDA